MEAEKTTPAQELEGMAAVAKALSDLDAEATGRVLRWAAERFGNVALPQPLTELAGGSSDAAAADPSTTPDLRFGSFAEMHAAAIPETDAEHVLVAAYWAQFVEGAPDFGAQGINAALRDLGCRVSNITNAFTSLISQRPQLAVQLRKSGSSKQARKTYKLTIAGKAAVEAMLGRGQ